MKANIDSSNSGVRSSSISCKVIFSFVILSFSISEIDFCKSPHFIKMSLLRAFESICLWYFFCNKSNTSDSEETLKFFTSASFESFLNQAFLLSGFTERKTRRTSSGICSNESSNITL